MRNAAIEQEGYQVKNAIALAFCLIIITCRISECADVSNKDSCKVLTLEESVALALKNNPNILYAQQSLISAEAGYGEQKAKVKPRLKAEANYVKSEGPSSEFLDFNEAKLTLSQPVYTGGKITSSIKQAEAKLTVAKQDYEKIKQDVAYEVKKAYYEILRAEKLRKISLEQIEQLREQLAQIKKHYESGSSIELDVMKTDAELSRAMRNLLKSENVIILAKIEFNKILGNDLQDNIEVKDMEAPEQYELIYLNEYLSEAFNNRPEMKKETAELATSQMDVAIAKSQWYPQVELSGSYGYSGKKISSLGKDWRGAISVNVPIWDWSETANKVKQAKAELEQKEIVVKATKDSITADMTKVYLSLKELKEEMDLVKKSREVAEKGLKVVVLLYDSGKAANEDVLDAFTCLRDAKIEYYQKYYDFLTAIARLENVRGYE